MDKECNKCGERKRLEDFPKHKTCTDGHLNTCKKCRHEYIKIYRAQNRDRINKVRRQKRRKPEPVEPEPVEPEPVEPEPEPSVTKVCNNCLETKSLGDFPKHKTSAGGRLNTCKKCRHEYIKSYRSNNRHKVNEARRKLYHGEKHKKIREREKLQKEFLEVLRKFDFPRSDARRRVMQPEQKDYEYVTLGIIKNRESVVKKFNKPKFDLSRKTKRTRYNKIYTKAKKLMKMYNDKFSFTSVVINKNQRAARHKDANNASDSYIIGLGDYTGGALRVWSEDEETFEDHDIKDTWFRFNGAAHFHETLPFEGERYSIVYYKI
jgi:hypothetical protein